MWKEERGKRKENCSAADNSFKGDGSLFFCSTFLFPLSSFVQRAKKQSFAAGDAGNEAIYGCVEAWKQRARDVPTRINGDIECLGLVGVEDPTYVLLVLLYIIGTRTIY